MSALRLLCHSAATLCVQVLLVLPAAAQLGPAFAGRMAAGENAAAVNSNPAAITRLPHLQVSLDSLFVVTDNEFEVGDETTVSGGNPKNDLDYAGIPLFSLSVPISDRLRFGFGLSVPAGLSTDYGDKWAGRYLAQESSLAFVSAQPVIAVRVTDQLSLGIGASIMYVSSESKVAVPNPGPNAPDGRLKADFDGVSAGPILSALFEPWPGTRFGASWRSEIEPRLKGRPKFRGLSPALEAQLDALGILGQNVKLDMRVPQLVQLGFYQRLTDRITLMGDFAWMDWSRFGKVDVTLGTNSVTAKATYEDIWAGSIGGEFRFDRQWRGRVGFTYVSSGVKNSNRTLALPMDESYVMGAGLMRQLGPHLELHANFLAVLSGSGKVDQDSVLTGRVEGKFDRRQSFVFQLAFVWDPAPDIW